MSQLDGVLPEFGTKSWHQVDIMEEENSEVIEKDGGSYRDRTCGPLIKRSLEIVSSILAKQCRRVL